MPVAAREASDLASETLALLSDHGIEFIALAGYLRLVPAAVVAAYRGRLVNIHPALLPAFGGAGMYGRRVHEAVLAAGCAVTGATVHFVDDRYDEGRIIAQWPVPVLPGDSADVLGARVLRVEHRLYPAVVAALLRRSAASEFDAVDNRAAASGAVRPPGDSFRLGVSLDGIENEIIALANL
jgi:phosphoribosylglycinamide formyltransferase 1